MNAPRHLTAIIATAIILVCSTLIAGCGANHHGDVSDDPQAPRFLNVDSLPEGGWRIVSCSPFDGSRDTIDVRTPLHRLIVMSTSHYGFLEAIGSTDAVVGISGKDFIFPDGQDLADIGYDGAADYEKIVGLKPDLLLTYTVSAAKSPFLTKLAQLGIPVLIVNEHLESHPLARASYIRLFGALTGRMEPADSVLSIVRENYGEISKAVTAAGKAPRKVLLNIPYKDQWFVPARDNYLSSLISDAGGEVLGTGGSSTASGSMGVEKAYSLSMEADCWLNVGWCQNLEQLEGINPVFPDMLRNIRRNATQAGLPEGSPIVWNDNARVNAKGGNDIWQSGVVRPDLVLRDLASIFNPTLSPSPLTYYHPLQ